MSNEKGRTYAQPIMVRRGEAITNHYSTHGRSPCTNYYTTKIETILKTTK